MIYLLKEYANEEFDVTKAMMMALIHDIVEIDAGDKSTIEAEINKVNEALKGTDTEGIKKASEDLQQAFYNID